MFFSLITVDYCAILHLLLDDFSQKNQQKVNSSSINYTVWRPEPERTTADGQNEIVCDEAHEGNETRVGHQTLPN